MANTNPPIVPPSPSVEFDRRTFVKTVSMAGLGLAALGTSSIVSAAEPARKKRYAIVGVGARHGMFKNAIEKDYKEHAELVAICDKNPGRLELARSKSEQNGAKPPAAYRETEFDKMIAETKPDIIIVTTPDAQHHEYVIRAMEKGCDTITEKPMTTTAETCQRLIDAKKRTGKNLRVTFNYRYSPPRSQVKDILMSGEIGDVLSVDFQWLLNTTHGADYFRRWHSQKKMSGGLMIHKATHHFDLVNWWLSALPVSVVATGKREFYTPATAKRMGLDSHHERCHTCPEKQKCTFYLDLAANPNIKALYLDNEKHDGYFRDQCVWRPEIDIEDTMNVIVGYDTGATLSYSLNAFNSWEGYNIAFNGTKGRLEHTIVEQIYISGTGADQAASDRVSTRVIPLRGGVRQVEPWSGTGGHGGGDKVMLDDIFLPNPQQDKYLRNADERSGAYSILIGVAANKCFQTGQPVKIGDLVKGLNRPDYAPMPDKTLKIPMPKRPEKA